MEMKSSAVLFLVFFALLMSTPLVIAGFDDDISNSDKDTFDEILEPVMKIYNLVKYSATVIAVIVMLFAGVGYMTSGNNPAKREDAKNMLMYVIMGLIVIWAAPLIVNFIVG